MPTTDANDPEPRPAATVVLLRPGEEGFEVLLTVRERNLRFMGGASVFPGGAVAPEDLDPGWEAASVLSGRGASERLGVDDEAEALGWFVCALREAFEEIGFIAGEGPVAKIARTEDAAEFRTACLAHGVRLATDRLVPAGRWVTPLGSPVRFDARFFLCPIDLDFEPIPDPREVLQVDWITPAQALVEMGAGSRLMAPPTVEMLQRLDAFATIEEAMAGLSQRGVGGSGRILSARLSPSVHVVLAPNAGLMTGPGTNTYIVGTEPSVVIDPAVVDAEYLDAVVEVAAGNISAILVTHRHPDHVGGVAALARRTGAPARAWGTEPAGGAAVESLRDGDLIEAGGARLTVIHAPGHASDHICFSLDGAATLFAGDNVLGEGTAVIAPPDGNMRDYLDSLHRLEALGFDRILPGHFRPLDGGTEVIRSYIAHRAEREAAILSCLSEVPITAEEIVERVYVDVSPQLHPIALYSVLAHLEMAESAGRVRRADDRWSAVRAD